MTRERKAGENKPDINDFFTSRTKQAIKEREQAYKEKYKENVKEAERKVKKGKQ